MYKFDVEGAINKKIEQFKKEDLNVSFEDVQSYLNKIYLKDKRVSDQALEEFVNEHNLKEIIDFLMAEAIIKS